ncbi:MAG: hypothetical protein AAGH48_07700, partial [Pseudomonadota bacterium]
MADKDEPKKKRGFFSGLFGRGKTGADQPAEAPPAELPDDLEEPNADAEAPLEPPFGDETHPPEEDASDGPLAPQQDSRPESEADGAPEPAQLLDIPSESPPEPIEPPSEL